MIEVAKAHERTCQEYQIHKQVHSMTPPPVTTPILCYKQALCQSLFSKALPRKPVANADALTTTGNAQCMGLHAATVARRTTGFSNAEALGGGSVHLVAHPLWKATTDNEDSAASSSTKAGDKEEEAKSSRDPLQEARYEEESHKIATLTVTEFLSGPAHPPKVTGLGNEVVSMKADLLRPQHPPKTTGEQFINTFTCDALTNSGNEEYNLTSNKGKAYTDTDSDGKTEIITDFTCKFKGKLIAMEV